MVSSEGHEEDTPERAQQCELLDNLEVLTRLPVFNQTPPEVLKLFAYFACRSTYAPGDILAQQGSPAGRAFLILEGQAEVIREHRGRVAQLELLSKMELFGPVALLTPFEWSMTLRAVTEVQALTLDRTSFRKIMARFPERNLVAVEKLASEQLKWWQKHLLACLDRLSER